MPLRCLVVRIAECATLLVGRRRFSSLDVSVRKASHTNTRLASFFPLDQTGAGKTFTMEGSETEPGVNHNVVAELFRLGEEHSAHTVYEFKVSMMEVYNEEVYDLFSPVRAKSAVRYTKERGGYAENLTEKSVACVEEVMAALAEGATHRSTGHTNMNAHSSRSHLVLTVHCQGHELTEGGKKYDARLNLVDLAGSERITKSAVKGAALLEAQAINKSLSSLGDVIQALGEKAKGGHVPFRNSKLTYILQKCLSQGSKVLMIANCSPVLANANETLCTLKFAHRCRTVSLGTAHSSKHHGPHPELAEGAPGPAKKKKAASKKGAHVVRKKKAASKKAPHT